MCMNSIKEFAPLLIVVVFGGLLWLQNKRIKSDDAAYEAYQQRYGNETLEARKEAFIKEGYWPNEVLWGRVHDTVRKKNNNL